MCSTKLLALVILIGPAFALTTAAEVDQPQVVRMELAGEAKGTIALGYGNCQWLFPNDTPQEKLLAEPQYRSDRPVYFAARYGNAEDDTYTFVIDESEGPGKDFEVVYVDANNDNRIDETNERFEFQLGSTRHAERLRLRILVNIDGANRPYHVSFGAFPYTSVKHPVEKIHATLRNSSYYCGEALFDGRRRKIAIADLDSNGLFNDVEQGLFHGDRFFVDLNGDGNLRSNSANEESFPCGRYTRIVGRWYAIVAAPDGSQIEIAEADPPLGTVEVPPRIRTAELYSPTQPLRLEFGPGGDGGSDQGVAGEYRVSYVYLLEKDESGPLGWGLTGKFRDDPPSITVREDRTVRLVAGAPLEVAASAVPKGDKGTIEFRLLITGVGGETYRWRQRGRDAPKAGFEIVDRTGKQIVSEKFEYG